LLAGPRLLVLRLARPAGRRLRDRRLRPCGRVPRALVLSAARAGPAAAAQASAAAARSLGGKPPPARSVPRARAAAHVHRQRDAGDGLGPVLVPDAALRRAPRPLGGYHRQDRKSTRL